jgi:hypothetical protein
MKQSTNHIFLVRPANFGFNTETAASNAFQKKPDLTSAEIKEKVWAEFDGYVNKLQSKGIDVTVIQDTEKPVKPDAIFPNNWGSFHADGTMVLYPMEAPNRRPEKSEDIISWLKDNYEIKKTIDLSKYEQENSFLEGTGSIIFDHIHQIAYACLSPRTDKDIFIEICDQLGYTPLYFTSTDTNGQEIYHTNVMMCVSEKFSVICLESIRDEQERETVIRSLEETGHEIIAITFAQVNHFAGNMLSVISQEDTELLIMSKSAYHVLSLEQKEALESYATLLPVDISTIESIGGGSVRCMISEIFLPVKKHPINKQ